MRVERNTQFELFNGVSMMAILALLDDACDEESRKRFVKYLKEYAPLKDKMPEKFKFCLDVAKECREESKTYDPAAFKQVSKVVRQLFEETFGKRKGKRDAEDTDLGEVQERSDRED